jgi:hypothetical protein
MILFLAAVVVLAAGLLGTLFLLFRDAHQGTKGLKRFLLSNWKWTRQTSTDKPSSARSHLSSWHW